MRSDKSRRRFVFLCVAPATILFFLFMILPTLNVFRMSLYERGAYSPNETFVGLKNFQHLLKDTQFIRSMQNMILLVVVVTIVTFAFALVFAAIDALVMLAYAALGAHGLRALPRHGLRWLDRICGVTLCALAASLALYTRRQS